MWTSRVHWLESSQREISHQNHFVCKWPTDRLEARECVPEALLPAEVGERAVNPYAIRSYNNDGVRSTNRARRLLHRRLHFVFDLQTSQVLLYRFALWWIRDWMVRRVWGRGGCRSTCWQFVRHPKCRKLSFARLKKRLYKYGEFALIYWKWDK